MKNQATNKYFKIKYNKYYYISSIIKQLIKDEKKKNITIYQTEKSLLYNLKYYNNTIIINHSKIFLIS